MNFTCTYCKKPIMGISIVIDKTHFLHRDCQEDFEFRKSENEFIDETIKENYPVNSFMKLYNKIIKVK